jgi:hypothetical protein
VICTSTNTGGIAIEMGQEGMRNHQRLVEDALAHRPANPT